MSLVRNQANHAWPDLLVENQTLKAWDVHLKPSHNFASRVQWYMAYNSCLELDQWYMAYNSCLEPDQWYMAYNSCLELDQLHMDNTSLELDQWYIANTFYPELDQWYKAYISYLVLRCFAIIYIHLASLRAYTSIMICCSYKKHHIYRIIPPNLIEKFRDAWIS